MVYNVDDLPKVIWHTMGLELKSHFSELLEHEEKHKKCNSSSKSICSIMYKKDEIACIKFL